MKLHRVIFEKIISSKIVRKFIKRYSNFLPIPVKDPVYLSVLAIVRNEGLYIKEWLDYHISMGVEHFYIYDNESTDNLYELLEPYIKNSLVTYNFWKGEVQQIPAYNDAIHKYRYETRWLAIIDVDEFICPSAKISIPQFLVDYEEYSALAINWQMFDSNGHETRPNAPVLESFTRVRKNFTKTNTHIKSIVNPLEVRRLGIHGHAYMCGATAVDENFHPLKANADFTQKTSMNKIRINHYCSKSKEEFILKVQRGRADSKEKHPIMEGRYNFAEETTHDYTILQHIDKKDFHDVF